MSTPRLKRRNHGRGHSYQIDGTKVLGVTTVLNALPKPALVNWAASQAAEKAVDEWDRLGQLPPSERLNELKWAHRSTTRKAAARGTAIHAYGEKLAHGEEVEIPDEYVGPSEAYVRFLDRWDISVHHTETPVGHSRFKYAGTADAWATIGKLDADELVLLDLKTGKGVYDEVSLQLTAYAYADLWQPDGPGSEVEKPDVERAFVAHILPDDVRLLPVEISEGLLTQFRYLMMTQRWISEAEGLVGEALQVGVPA